MFTLCCFSPKYTLLPTILHAYNGQLYGLCNLSDRQKTNNITFIYKLILSYVDSVTLLTDINFRVTTRQLKISPSLAYHLSTANYHFNSPLQRLMHLSNEYPAALTTEKFVTNMCQTFVSSCF